MPWARPAILALGVSAHRDEPPQTKLTTQLPLLPSDENTIKDTVNTHYILSMVLFLSHKLPLLGGMEANFTKSMEDQM